MWEACCDMHVGMMCMHGGMVCPMNAINMLEMLYMWQSQIEIEYYSIAYFERITEFDVL